jgi:hypothetical protein
MNSTIFWEVTIDDPIRGLRVFSRIMEVQVLLAMIDLLSAYLFLLLLKYEFFSQISKK